MNNDSIDKKPDNTGDQKNGYDQAQKSDKKPRRTGVWQPVRESALPLKTVYFRPSTSCMS